MNELSGSLPSPISRDLEPDSVNADVLLTAILESSDECIMIVDLEGRLLFLSQGGMRGMEVDDFTAVKDSFWPDFWSGDGNVSARNAIATAAAGGNARFTAVANTAKGKPHFWDVQLRPLVGPDGRPTHLLSISRDISGEQSAKAEIAKLLEEERQAAQREAETLRRLLLDAPSFMCLLDGPEHVFKIANEAYLQLVGHRDLIGLPVREAVPDVEGQGFYELLDQVYSSGAPFSGRGVNMNVQRTPGGPFECVYLNFVYQPVFDEHGSVSGIFVEGSDITDLKNAELALRSKELQLELALEAAEMGVWECTVANGRFVDLKEDERAMRLLNRRSDEDLHFDGFAARLHPDDRLAVAESAERALAPEGNGILDVEYRMLERPDMPAHWIHARAKVVTTDGITKFIGTVRDISELKDAEARQHMVSGELQHRIKNLLAMVSAIATQTLRGDDIAERRETFNARLHVLAQAQDMLMSTEWESAGIYDTLRAALAPHGGSDGRFDISGPDFTMTPKQSLSMALTLHELATNATKYGALSNDTGRIKISWTIGRIGEQKDELEFVWRETGGAAVSEPKSKGFGSRLISRVLAADFNGDVRINYPVDGVVCTLTAHLART
jgi:two-component sensor histidine kinase